ncbi:hypothetical protein A9Z42_0002420 [Trichoderma parareesei]|uniref:Uncharacterized protein n=1 Tax=Trichoderma parareesei TaxID=858221 RepID=A0A2H3A9R0_TRIPA|nr:hypothetical protein A9Z42_0002420 [Trichoderma parareesei]
MSGRQPSSGFKLVAMPCSDVTVIPHLTEEQLRSCNAALGLPNFLKHFASEGPGTCGMFMQSDGSYVFILRKSTDVASITTALRYDPQTNVARGFLYFKPRVYHISVFEKMIDQFVQCSHPLLLPLLAVELTCGEKMGNVMGHTNELDAIEMQTGHGMGKLDAQAIMERHDYRTLVRQLGVVQSQYDLALATLSWCRISAEFIRAKLQHLQGVLPKERQRELEVPCRMLDERVEFLLNSIDCARVYNGIKERMESQQTVLFNLIAQSDNLINVGLAKDSKEMAVASKQDSSAMKIIALLTTFFLPGTFIATFFAMPLFDWSAPTLSRVTNQHFWVYWAVTGPLTLTTMAGVMVWALWHNRYVEQLQKTARDSVGPNSSTGDSGQGGQGQTTPGQQTPQSEAKRKAALQKYSLRGILNRRKRSSVVMGAQP